MATIPRIFARRQLPAVAPNVAVSPNITGAGDVNRSLAQLDARVARFAQVEVTARRTAALAGAETGAIKELSELQAAFEKDPDHKTKAQRFDVKSREILARHGAALDRVTSPIFQRNLSRITASKMLAITRLARRQEIDEARGALNSSRGVFLTDALKAGSAAERAVSIQGFTDQLVRAKAAGHISAVEAERIGRGFRAELGETLAIRILRSNPSALLKVLRSVSGRTREGRRVLQNPDGSVSTEETVTVTDRRINGGRATNIPTIFNGQRVSQAQAIENIARAGGKDPETGRKLEGFDTIEAATAAARKRSEELGRSVGRGGNVFDAISPRRRERLIFQAERAVKALGATARRETLDIARNRLARLQAQGSEVPKDERFSKVSLSRQFGERRGGQMFEALEGARRFGDMMVKLRTAAPEEVKALRAELNAKTKTDKDFILNRQRRRAFDQALRARNISLTKDPAAHVVASDETVGAKFQAMTALLGDANASPAARRAATQAYVASVLAAQERMGVPASLRKVLPEIAVQGEVERFRNIDVRTGGAILKDLNERYGTAAPAVFRQFAKRLSPAGRVLATMPAGDASNRLAAAVKLGEKKLTELAALQRGDSVKIDEAVTKALRPLEGTFAGHIGADQTALDYRGAVRLLALRRIADGERNVAAAARQAAREVILDRYEIFDSYRVPKALGDLKVSEVNVGARRLLSNRDWLGSLRFDIVTRGSAIPRKAARQQAINSLRANGTWRSAPEEDGLILFWGDGRPVTVNGEPVKVPWTGLSQAGRAVVSPVDIKRSQEDLGPFLGAANEALRIKERLEKRGAEFLRGLVQ